MTIAQISGITYPSNYFNNYSRLLPDLAYRLLLYAISLAGLFFFLRLVLAGYSFMASTGDPAKIDLAQKQITHALLGLIIVIATFFIMQLVQAILIPNII
jgi:hypothetical protein